MIPRSKTIRIFIPDGDPASMKVAEITSNVIEVNYIPRARLSLAGERGSLMRAGIYILVGWSEEHQKPECYIGEAENCMNRLLQHDAQKPFWTYALGIVSKTNHFTKAHVKYLEWLCYERAVQAGMAIVHNAATPTKPHVEESTEHDLLDNFDALAVLVSMLGLSLFKLDAIAFTPPVPTAPKEALPSSGDTALDEETEIERLAQLSTVEYERERKTAIVRLQLRGPALDRLVKETQKRKRREEEARQAAEEATIAEREGRSAENTLRVSMEKVLPELARKGAFTTKDILNALKVPPQRSSNMLLGRIKVILKEMDYKEYRPRKDGRRFTAWVTKSGYDL